MDKKRKTIATIGQSLALAGFALAAMASSSSKESFNSDDFRDGLNRGYEVGSEIGRALGSDATPEMQRLDIDSIPMEQSENVITD